MDGAGLGVIGGGPWLARTATAVVVPLGGTSVAAIATARVATTTGALFLLRPLSLVVATTVVVGRARGSLATPGVVGAVTTAVVAGVEDNSDITGAGGVVGVFELIKEQHVPQLEEAQRGHKRADLVEALVEALENVVNKGIVGDKGTNINKSVGNHLLLVAVLDDNGVALLELAEGLAEVGGTCLLVVTEQGLNAVPDDKSRSVVLLRVPAVHHHVDELEGDGVVQPVEDSGIKAEPLVIAVGGRLRREVVTATRKKRRHLE